MVECTFQKIHALVVQIDVTERFKMYEHVYLSSETHAFVSSDYKFLKLLIHKANLKWVKGFWGFGVLGFWALLWVLVWH